MVARNGVNCDEFQKLSGQLNYAKLKNYTNYNLSKTSSYVCFMTTRSHTVSDSNESSPKIDKVSL